MYDLCHVWCWIYQNVSKRHWGQFERLVSGRPNTYYPQISSIVGSAFWRTLCIILSRDYASRIMPRDWTCWWSGSTKHDSIRSANFRGMFIDFKCFRRRRGTSNWPPLIISSGPSLLTFIVHCFLKREAKRRINQSDKTSKLIKTRIQSRTNLLFRLLSGGWLLCRYSYH